MSPVRLAVLKLGESSPDNPHTQELTMSYRVRTFILRGFREHHCPACNKVLSCKCPEDEGRVSFTCWFHCRAQGLIYNAFSVGEASDLWLVWAESVAGTERISLFTHLPWLPCEHVCERGLKGCFLISFALHSGNLWESLGVVQTWEAPSFYFIFLLMNLSWMMFWVNLSKWAQCLCVF